MHKTQLQTRQTIMVYKRTFKKPIKYKHTWEAGTDVHEGVMLDSRFFLRATAYML